MNARRSRKRCIKTKVGDSRGSSTSGLYCQAEDKNAAALDCLTAVVKRSHAGLNHVIRHGMMDFARRFDEAGVLARLAHLPSQIEWIDGNAVTAQSRVRGKTA
jgi:hypothetical protein